ncbi:alpha/beta hydrolase [Streptomyces sp. OZ13]|uniref:alpha/beta hydrolase n=1 Tax=Streptomyces sp. OZ13 TaxID=3452210 RepID=UPI003F8C352D
MFKDGLPQLSVPGWKELGQAVARAGKGDASALSTRVVATADDPAFSGPAVGCLDMRANFRGYPALKTQMALDGVVAPHTRGTGQSYQYIAQCLRWPVPFSNPPRPAAGITPGVTPLIVNALYDPSTAYAWAQLMLTEFKDAVLLTRDGAGHTSYMYPGPARDAVDRYLITGETPPPAWPSTETAAFGRRFTAAAGR